MTFSRGNKFWHEIVPLTHLWLWPVRQEYRHCAASHTVASQQVLAFRHPSFQNPPLLLFLVVSLQCGFLDFTRLILEPYIWNTYDYGLWWSPLKRLSSLKNWEHWELAQEQRCQRQHKSKIEPSWENILQTCKKWVPQALHACSIQRAIYKETRFDLKKQQQKWWASKLIS